MERCQDITYVCYDNGAYMNTGIQRSSATPHFADTTTSPAGKVIPGKMQSRKDLAKIMVGHHIPYVAQTLAMTNFKDLYEKSEKAIYTPGAAFLNIMAPCPRGWRYNTPDIMEICKLGVETCYWPLFEVVEGKWILNYEPKNKMSLLTRSGFRSTLDFRYSLTTLYINPPSTIRFCSSSGGSGIGYALKKLNDTKGCTPPLAAFFIAYCDNCIYQ